jgi:hypothetical protein
VESAAGRPRAYWLGYWIPPDKPNVGIPFLGNGDSVYEVNSKNEEFANAFYGVDGSGPYSAISSNAQSPFPFRHWCELPALDPAGIAGAAWPRCRAYAPLTGGGAAAKGSLGQRLPPGNGGPAASRARRPPHPRGGRSPGGPLPC